MILWMPLVCTTGAEAEAESFAVSQWSRSSDITLWSGNAEWRRETKRSKWTLVAGARRTEVDYEPQSITFNQFSRSLRTDSYSAEVRGEYALHPRLHASLSGSFEAGYPDHRSVWIDEYYRQVFAELGYVEPDPISWNISLGGRWEWVPAHRLLDFQVDFGRSRIAPGYERDISTFPFTTLRDREWLHRIGLISGIEAVLSRRVRMRAEVTMGWTSDRDPRLGSRVQVSIAFRNNGVLRSEVSGAREGDGFASWALQSTLEFDWDEVWFFGGTVRSYVDTGEIEESLAFSSAAPALEATRFGLFVRYLGERHSLRVYVGPYFSNYAPPADERVVPFRNLYRDRHWWQFEFAHHYTF